MLVSGGVMPGKKPITFFLPTWLFLRPRAETSSGCFQLQETVLRSDEETTRDQPTHGLETRVSSWWFQPV